MEVANILIQHLERSAEGTPRFAVGTVRVAGCYHIRARLVDGAVNQETCRVCGAAHVASNCVAVVVDENHVASFEEAEVLPERIRPCTCQLLQALGRSSSGRRYSPEGVRVLRVSDGDVPAHALCVAFASEDSKSESHLLQHPLSMLCVGREGRDAGEADALRDHF